MAGNYYWLASQPLVAMISEFDIRNEECEISQLRCGLENGVKIRVAFDKL